MSSRRGGKRLFDCLWDGVFACFYTEPRSGAAPAHCCNPAASPPPSNRYARGWCHEMYCGFSDRVLWWWARKVLITSIIGLCVFMKCSPRCKRSLGRRRRRVWSWPCNLVDVLRVVSNVNWPVKLILLWLQGMKKNLGFLMWREST